MARPYASSRSRTIASSTACSNPPRTSAIEAYIVGLAVALSRQFGDVCGYSAAGERRGYLSGRSNCRIVRAIGTPQRGDDRVVDFRVVGDAGQLRQPAEGRELIGDRHVDVADIGRTRSRTVAAAIDGVRRTGGALVERFVLLAHRAHD